MVASDKNRTKELDKLTKTINRMVVRRDFRLLGQDRGHGGDRRAERNMGMFAILEILEKGKVVGIRDGNKYRVELDDGYGTQVAVVKFTKSKNKLFLVTVF